MLDSSPSSSSSLSTSSSASKSSNSRLFNPVKSVTGIAICVRAANLSSQGTFEFQWRPGHCNDVIQPPHLPGSYMERSRYSDAIPARKHISSLNKSRAIISHKLRNSSPMTENVLTNKRHNCRCSLGSQHMPFQIHSQGAPSLDDLAVATGSWHNHSIDMGFVKQSAHDRNSWGNVQFSGLVNLAFVAGADVPLHVYDQPRPPEAQQQTRLD